MSPGFSSKPMYLPRASCAEAARRSPWLPVASTSRFRRGTLSASSGSSVAGKPSSTSAACAVFSMVFIARPSTTTCRPASRPASASVFSRATFEAKVVATTMPSAAPISAPSGSISDASDRPGCGEKTLVELQISTFTPSSPNAREDRGVEGLADQRRRIGLEVAGVQDPPRRRVDHEAEVSGIECEIGRKPTVNGPA